MGTELATRPFPFTCHAVKRTYPRRLFFASLGMIAIVIAVVTLARDLSADPDWQVRVYGNALAAVIVLMVFLAPFSAGFRDVLPNRVVTLRGATWIVPKFVPIEQLIRIAWSSATLVAGSLLTFYAGPAILTSGIRWIGMGPGFVVIGVWGIIDGLFPLMRGIKMTPQGFTYWRLAGTVTLRWDEIGDVISTSDVRDHTERRFLSRFIPFEDYQWYFPGAKIVIPADKARATAVPVLWEDENTPRLLLEVDHLIVEPSALITAILALRDRPELRPLLGTRASRHLFVGPPWRVRRHMYRTQQWWPKGAVPDGIAVDRDGVVKEFP